MDIQCGMTTSTLMLLVRKGRGGEGEGEGEDERPGGRTTLMLKFHTLSNLNPTFVTDMSLTRVFHLCTKERSLTGAAMYIMLPQESCVQLLRRTLGCSSACTEKI